MNKKEKNIVQKVVNIVFESKRPMPAHFCVNKKRKQTFFIDFNDLSADDESNMASCAYHSVEDFKIEYQNKNEIILLVKIGEDMMIGSYIINKLQHGELSHELFKILLDENKKIFGKKIVTLIDNNWTAISRYFEYCLLFGENIALYSKQKIKI